MRSLLLAPHADDETLFCAFTIAAHAPHVMIVARDPDPDTAIIRGSESIRACREMATDVTVDYLGHSVEGHVDEDRVAADLADLRDVNEGPWRVFAPAVEEHGHREHNLVGQAAVDVFGAGCVTPYLTYTRTGGRSTLGDEVRYENEWISRKLRALACFQSQIDHPDRRPWFYDQIDLREFYV